MMKHIRIYIPNPADVLLWYKGTGVLGALSWFLGSNKYYHSSMVVLNPKTGLYYNYEQNADIVSENPMPVSEVVSSFSGTRFLVMRPKLELLKENFQFTPTSKDINPQKLLLCVTKNMEKIVQFHYSGLDVFRSYWSRIRRLVRFKNVIADENGVELLYAYRIPGSEVEWLAVESRKTFTCSGAIASAFAACGIQLFPFLPWYVLPGDFSKNPFFDALGYLDYTSSVVGN